jgi:ankyrin repeat protein
MEAKNEVDGYNFYSTGFIYACANGHFEIMKYLILNNCKTNEYSRCSGFLRACQNGHFEIVKYLILNNCEIFNFK